MIVERVSCLGVAKDAWKKFDRIFWVTLRAGQYLLMMSDANRISDEKIYEEILLVLGTGEFRGLNFTGSYDTKWDIVVSIGGFLTAYQFNKDLSKLDALEDICPGSYPRMFWSEELNLGLLVYFRDGCIVGRFTSDWLDYKSEIMGQIFIKNSLLGQSFKALWYAAEGISMLDWLGIYEELNTLNIGENIGYLD